MKGLLASAALLGIVVIAAINNSIGLALPAGNLAEITPDSPSLSAVEKSPDPRLGGVVMPLDLSAPSAIGSAGKEARAHSEPHGHETCASGCAVSHHPTPRLTEARCRALLTGYQREPFDQESESLDALLYFGAQTSFQLRKESLREMLDANHLRFLQGELSRDRAVVSLRLIDQHGKVRAECPATEVPQHVRQVFDCDVYGLQPLVCSGTVKRVGKNHIWQRL